MEFTDLLTIAMPVYERKEYFREALESALNQTVKCKVIVIDNCSSHDFFEQICKKKNVTYYRNDSNIGIAGNFARGFELSESKYVLNLQDDDVLHPQYVESFVDAVTKHPDIDVFYSDFITMTSEGEKPHHHTLPFGYMETGERVIEYGIKYRLGFPYMTSAILKAKAHSFLEIKDLIGSYDWEWIYSVADRFAFYGESRKLYKYRIHDNQTTHKTESTFLLTLPFIYENVLDKKVTDPKLKKKVLKNAFWELVRLKSMAGKREIKSLLNGQNKYELYLKEKLDSNRHISLIFHSPRCFVKLIYKCSCKLGINS
ncbi:MAG: glycosyltransferase family 2 protein [Draconibacterium sp.]